MRAPRAQGLALEIGPDDLRMDQSEASQLLGAAGVDLPDEEIAELTEHTEGWSAGLYLAALSIRARGVKAKGAATFSGSDRLVSDYLRSELLAHLSPDDFRFLTRTAVLEWMSAPLCDAVLETSGTAAILESLERSNLFLVPLDRSGDTYRYHHLFQELLRSDLARAEPDLVPPLLVRASAWCEANGQPEAAIRYAQEAGDVDRVARLFERSAHLAYQSGRFATVERWLQWLDAHGAVERNAAVAVLGALDRRRPGPTGGGGPLDRCGRKRELLGDPARRQPFDRLVARLSACSALSWRRGEDARRRGACAPDARPSEPVPAERLAVPRICGVDGR